MKTNSLKLLFLIKKNLETTFLVCFAFFVIISMQFYNLHKNQTKQNFLNILNNIYLTKSLNHIFNNLEPKFITIEHKIVPGQTINKILKNYGIAKQDIQKLEKKLSELTNPKNLKNYDKLIFTIKKSKNNEIIDFLYPISKTKKIFLTKNLENKSFKAEKIIKNLNKKVVYKEGKILQSLYRSAIKQKIKPNIIVEFARLYGFQIDFQRDIRKNDNYQILYEIFQDEDGKTFETGKIIFANLVLRGEEYPMYYFKDSKNVEEHYDVNGKSIKKSLMKTPINGARLSSSFGMRKHPILGFNKMHRGTDFAAKKGTPVMASGDGIIIRARWCGGGGNCIKIKHNSTYSTVYAHLWKFAAGIKEGIRVKQARVIGYVGSTGMSTGPHLHYEVIANGKRVNSQTLKLPSGKVLSGSDRKLFEIKKIKTDVLISETILEQ